MTAVPRRSVLRGIAAGGFTAAVGSTVSATNSLAAGASAGHRAHPPLPISDPGNTDGWIPDPRFTDEFRGPRLDPAKWYDRITFWDGRAPSYFDPSNVSVHRGRASIPFRNLNTVSNPSFENGLTGWHPSGSGVQAVDEGTVSANAVQLPPNSSIRQRITGLRPLTQYRLTTYAKVAPGTTAVLRAQGYNCAKSHELVLTTEDYQPAGFTFTTGHGTGAVTVLVENRGGGSVDATMIAVVEARADAPLGSYFSTGAIQSRTQAQYGYYEVRAKVADSSSTSSFWFQGSETEIDVMECIGRPMLDPDYGSIMPMNLHYFPGGWENDQAFPVLHDTGVSLAEDFHVYGVDWQEDSIRFYFDGTLVQTVEPNLHWHEPEYLFLDSEAFLWHGFPTPDTLPSTYEIDYVRGWQRH